MNLILNNWTDKDIKEFKKYLATFSKGKESAEWEKRIINTKLPTLAVPSEKVREIVRNIYKGNFISFIDLWPWDNATTTFVMGGLISKVKDINMQKKYLLKYSLKADNWATIDSVKPKVTDRNRVEYIDFARKCVLSKHSFTRRLGLIICLKSLADDTIDDILKIASSLINEKEYYVNMAGAWLVAECFIKYREKTLVLFKNNSFNKFVTNKAISKCRDSYRVSAFDKEMLKQYKLK